MAEQRFEALSRICLNNWHYMNHRTLSFSEGINFFTGHSGSGKSTVIDAMQIVLYANTDGRGFFNKAAADDSDRSLIEYLRGMVNIEENNQFSYLRNKNFSSTIVLEFVRTDTRERQCAGVIFDVETASNSISRLFFWHKGGIPEHEYRMADRTMSIDEVKSFLKREFSDEECYYGSHNERFRSLLYNVYLGGLDGEKFPLLFKRAIPFRMDIKLEDFVKEYICTETNIHIEDMQESVMQYGRMRKKIEDTAREIRELERIGKQFSLMEMAEKEEEKYDYLARKMEILELRQRVHQAMDEAENARDSHEKQKEEKAHVESRIKESRERSEELLRKIASSGYEDLKERLASVNELAEKDGRSLERWKQTSDRLGLWEEEDCTANQTLWDMEAFKEQKITEEELSRLQNTIKDMRKETAEQQREAEAEIRRLTRQEKELEEDLKKLRQGKNPYPKDLEYTRNYIQKRLLEETGKSVPVEILADLIDIKSDTWRNAVEGYLGSSKLALVVAPKYVEAAMKIYEEMDKSRCFRAALVDTEKILEHQEDRKDISGSLAEEVTTFSDYVRAYVDFLLGNVEKCDNREELRKSKVGVTPDCLLYRGFRLQNMNPDSYTKQAAIGSLSRKKRMEQMEGELGKIREEKLPLEEIRKSCERILSLEALEQPVEEYMVWLEDIGNLKKRRGEKKRLEEKLEEIKEDHISKWEEERSSLESEIQAAVALTERAGRTIWQMEETIRKKTAESLSLSEELAVKEQDFKEKIKSLKAEKQDMDSDGDSCSVMEYEKEMDKLLKNGENLKYDRLKDRFRIKSQEEGNRKEALYGKLQEIRMEYLRTYPGRPFSPAARDNLQYDKLLKELQCDRLEEYGKKADEQARAAVLHFKDDFIFKIRTAIREALRRKDELNKIISTMDFGKDKYQFVIGKNKGPDGRYYDMFMDDALEINPSSLSKGVENQMNLFTMEHETNYGLMMNELIQIFIPPENATSQEMEDAKRRMDKYADYRTYLSFDMQQIIEGEETIRIPLSKMIRKNSGGEGQNPFYVALLASFAQIYRINMSPRAKRQPTIRLVILDEAFSKMDAEKVASCIGLIRDLGFQAIISATNDKIQNYLENVDKTFVFANPNKKHISVQEFEKKEFSVLV